LERLEKAIEWFSRAISNEKNRLTDFMATSSVADRYAAFASS
jgi:hypothetical protein